MKSKIYAYMLTLGCMAFLLAGCGSGGTTPELTKHTLNESLQCIGCHEDSQNPKWVSPGTGKSVVTEWMASTHNTKNGASCSNCHGSDFDNPAKHPLTCVKCHTVGGQTFTDSSTNPDSHGRCAKCHDSATGVFPTGTRRAHFAKSDYPVIFGGYTASYVSTNYIGNCRKCHNPHDTTTNMAYNRAWAESGHGNTTAGARVSRDFKLYGTGQPSNLAYTNSGPSPSTTTDPAVLAKATPICVRCHTTTGFVNFVESGFVNVKPFGSNTDKTKEVTGCDACHSGYGFKVRNIPAVTIYFNFSGVTVPSAGNPGGHLKIQNNALLFADLKASNVCIPCHSGRGIGSQIKQLQALGIDFGSTNSPSAHDFAGAALLTAEIGYEFAGKEYVTGLGAVTDHDTVGLSSGKGPCVTCHMNKATKSDSHTFKPVIHNTAQFPLYTTNRTWSQVYSVSTNSPASLTVSTITSLSCNTTNCHAGLTVMTVAGLNSDKEGFISALAVYNKWIRLVRNVPVLPQSAFNTTTNKARATNKWDYLGSGTGPDLMGSAFNLSLLNNEPGAYVHNPLYAKRLIYDSIQFISTKATDPALLTLQYPTTQQFNVADAIHYLTTTTERTLETVNTAANTAVRALVTQQQADAAIQWLYGKTWANLTPADKLKRPGDN